ncbi:MAG TPA: AAA family ATPase [Chthonomonadaceae bacterium]|nr:AAA family ATPase [Chthonomonadaceae bacterium]
MLTRLKVNGFKNLMNVDVRFGPFTCIAGANGVGKSNLFDAIHFLSALADQTLIDAALSVRTGTVRSLFHRIGDEYASEMSFEAEMIVPQEGIDDLGQEAKASITFLRYSLVLAYRMSDSRRSLGSLEILKEELTHITLGDANKHLLFPHSLEWRKSAVVGVRRSPYFISTEGTDANRAIKLHQDGGSSGRPLSRSAANLPRTILSNANAAESPTVLLARREMQSWRLLQLEPSSLRKPDEYTAPTHLDMDGSHLAATLYHLARQNRDGTSSEEEDSEVYGQIASRLSELIQDVREVWIDRDEQRELLTLQVKGHDKTSHSSRVLSDGTLRFLALAVLELDPETQGVLCLEEPENGIHPGRIPAILRLLQDITTDVSMPIGLDNPLRQVIINTHSPSVVMQIPDDSLLVAELRETVANGKRFHRACFGSLPDTWRAKAPDGVVLVPRGVLISYLNPVVAPEPMENNRYSNGLQPARQTHWKTRRVVDRPDLQPLLPFGAEIE